MVMTSSVRVSFRVWWHLPQHSDSEGALPRPATGGSCKLEEEEEELCSRKFSLEQLSFSEGEELEEELEQEDREEEEEEVGLPGSEEQVEDFASSVLAAISCWHHRVVMVTVRLLPAALHLRLCSAPPPATLSPAPSPLPHPKP